MAIDYAEKHKTPRQEGESCRGVCQRVMRALADEIRGGCRRCGSRGLGWWEVAGGKWLAVFVGEVEETVSFGCLFQPVDEGFHLCADDILCASEADADDYEGHVGDSEMAFGAFPQAELNGAVLAEVVDAGSDRVPVECGIIVVAAKHFGDIGTEV